MSEQNFNASEQELERAVASSAGTMVVFLNEPFHPGARMMGERLNRVAADGDNFRVMDVSLAAYRAWAASYDVYGTPAALIFRNGKLADRILGVVDEDSLRRLVG